MQINWHKIAHSITNYIAMHLFLTIVSMPIIVAWGLPFSWLSPIGNFIFSPLLSLFLLVCSLAFFAELLYLPHGICDWLIEQLTQVWHWMLNCAPSNVLYGIYAPPWWFLTFIALGAAVTITHPIMRSSVRRVIWLGSVLFGAMLMLKIAAPQTFVAHIPCNNGAVMLMRRNNQTILIDPGVMGSRISAQSWVAYTLMPELIARTGSLIIDHCILLKPSILTFDAAQTLCRDAQVKKIYLPQMKGELQGSFKRSFGKLYAQIKNEQIALSRLKSSSKHIACSDEIIFPLEYRGQKRYQTIEYPAFKIQHN